MRALLVLLLLIPSAAWAQDTLWRATLYGGIATRLSTSEVFLDGHFHPDGDQIGLALDRDLADIGSGFTFVGEGSVTHFVTKSDETTIDLGLGLRYDFSVLSAPIAISGFTGPSYADDPPIIATGTWHGTPIDFRREPWLNYVGAEIAVGITPGWNAVLRYYHRSGAFGIFAPNADEGGMFGVGLQAVF